LRRVGAIVGSRRISIAKAVARKRLMKTQQAGNRLSGGYLYLRGVNGFTNPNPVYSYTHAPDRLCQADGKMYALLVAGNCGRGRGLIPSLAGSGEQS
jgi:hypothetical protein